MSDHKPYSNEIYVDGRAKGTLESGGKLETSLIGALMEGISKGDLLSVILWQQSYLAAEEMGGKVMRSSSELLHFYA